MVGRLFITIEVFPCICEHCAAWLQADFNFILLSTRVGASRSQCVIQFSTERNAETKANAFEICEFAVEFVKDRDARIYERGELLR